MIYEFLCIDFGTDHSVFGLEPRIDQRQLATQVQTLYLVPPPLLLLLLNFLNLMTLVVLRSPNCST